jgi:hypothetical protein
MTQTKDREKMAEIRDGHREERKQFPKKSYP